MNQEQKSKEQILEEALKQINGLCGVVNFSSHNQMREAIEGAVELSDNAIQEYAQQREQPWVEKFTIGFTEWLITHPDKWMFSKKLMTWWSPYLTEDKCTSELIKLYKESFPPAPPKEIK